MLDYLFYSQELLLCGQWLKNYHCVNYFLTFSLNEENGLKAFLFYRDNNLCLRICY